MRSSMRMISGRMSWIEETIICATVWNASSLRLMLLFIFNWIADLNLSWYFLGKLTRNFFVLIIIKCCFHNCRGPVVDVHVAFNCYIVDKASLYFSLSSVTCCAGMPRYRHKCRVKPSSGSLCPLISIFFYRSVGTNWV